MSGYEDEVRKEWRGLTDAQREMAISHLQDAEDGYDDKIGIAVNRGHSAEVALLMANRRVLYLAGEMLRIVPPVRQIEEDD